MASFQTKPITVEAMRWSGRLRDIDEVFMLLALASNTSIVIGLSANGELHLPVNDASLLVQPGDWIVKHNERIRVLKPAEFTSTYEPLPAVPVP